MDFLTTTGAFIIVLGIIIFVHEFGHFVTAKAFGMRVFIFSFGFGKRLIGFKWGDTDCRVSLIPLGGYVKLEGEPDDHLSEDDPSLQTVALADGTMVKVENPNYFTNRPRWQRFLVYLAGPFMNAVLTVGVIAVFHMVGFGIDAVLLDPPVIGAVDPGSPGAAAGLAPGDVINAIDGKSLATWEEAMVAIMLRPDTTISVETTRGSERKTVTIKSGSKEKMGDIGVSPLVRVGQVVPGKPAAEAGLQADDGILQIGDKPVRSFLDILDAVGSSGGQPVLFHIYRQTGVVAIPVTPRNEGSGYRVGLANKTVIKKFGFFAATRESLRWTWKSTVLTFETLKRLLTAQLSPKTLMGPLGIARASGDAARAGAGQLFFLVAMISLQVGILNLFPLAPLDGGHLAILVGEGVIRRDFSLNVKNWIMNAGFCVLLLLIGLVLYSDLSKTSLLGKYLP
jgi:regulator of sigma E protease